MPVTQQHKQHEDTEQHNRGRLKALIGKQVRHTLGEPDDLLKVQKGDHEEITDQMGLNMLGSPAQAENIRPSGAAM
jgi:hypothetical protein